MNQRVDNSLKRESIFKILDSYPLKELLMELEQAGQENPLSLFDDHPDGREAVEEMIEIEAYIDDEERAFLIPAKLDLIALLFSIEMDKLYGIDEESHHKEPTKILQFPGSPKS